MFGEGPRKATVMLVGEQPGNQEDLRGQPFVGPSGKIIDDLCDELGIDRADVYVTNAVKHFKWHARGKIRLHQKPDLSEIAACHPWLEAEINSVQPRIILCLGATAARAVLGKTTAIGASRGKSFEASGAKVLVTWHPSAILRSPELKSREEKLKDLKADLKAAWAATEL